MPEQYLEEHQTHPDPISPYEQKLSGAIMEVFGRGVHDLPGLIEGLNGLGLNAPDGSSWNEDNFRAEMRRLGD
ncbi:MULTISPECIES: recombinase-like helix-turn-helix domain-containing protein [unclassified Geodermatophilus]|uniref:recombinase-like helix-turn-helix domain-containing protein n=1 Tax=unclassified Geodermatophilus TaxID=2637632 RepID=UPI003EEC4673